MIKAIIVDDEPYCCEALATLLEDSPEVEVMAICYNAADALTAIHKYSPDLVFLDVEMPKMNGFEMLEQLPSVNFEIIFTTSYDQYALKDDERISRLDNIYAATEEKYEFAQSFAKAIAVYATQKQQDLNDLKALQKLYAP